MLQQCIQFSNHITKVSKSWNSFERVSIDVDLGTIKTIGGDALTFTLPALKLPFFSSPSTLEHLLWTQSLQLWQSIQLAPTLFYTHDKAIKHFVAAFWL